MSRFRFRLERLLRLREKKEQEKAGDLGRAVRNEEALRKAADNATDYLKRVGEQLSDSSGEVVSIGTLRNLNMAMRAAARDARSAQDDLEVSEKTRLKEQEEFNEAHKDRRIIERMREKRHENWRKNKNREDQKEQDGLAQQRWVSRGGP